MEKFDEESSRIWDAEVLRIKKFGGEHQEWTTFATDFVNIVHNKQEVPTTIKLKHLRSLLQGETRAMVNHLLLNNNEENY